jgi:hypothetical protein
MWDARVEPDHIVDPGVEGPVLDLDATPTRDEIVELRLVRVVVVRVLRESLARGDDSDVDVVAFDPELCR